jgi:antitoxin MazE
MARRTGSGNHSHTRVARVNGRDGEWAVIVQARDHTRVARIGPDGEADRTTEVLVPTHDVVDVKRTHVTQIGGRGALILPASLRTRYGFDEATLVQITEEPDGVFVRKVRVVPAGAPEPLDLDVLLDGVTPENLHEEIDFGPARGAEVF